MHGAENHRTEASYEPLLQFEMEMGAFLSDWNHCDQLSSFMARMISHNRTDPVRHSNFFSSALNELLEVSFRGGSPDGRIGCAVYRRGPTERVELTFPCPPGQRQFYGEAVAKTHDGDAHARYLDSIAADLAPSREAVLLDLSINFDADVRLGESDPPSITLVVDLPLEGVVR
ncbi:ubiquinone biosynthesis methyltransferase UbiE [Sinorhizobium medicae]|uniref:ubiquinone biosynthesis methyltransferase UbiE n=1 Tax=Sinorhizobium medicae TaxID=110321 RepID=UPI000FD6BC15|nr:ubiquinone biosynthesis methyltransferase UbiE [Sinorhizobium medicae]MDX0602674.1 ubiquinone biosynthesis methyltransferase UbiE [Sinorhizobium medicae]MDX0818818.1 ubiquinone biosynthesis methyltransferase UbiE [Sinorhizobium medicae]MDX0861915.1 ubiquinone biosynthesis methyltransferase UbiE [Sinorhizobium medicae]RVJ33610.1 ubiquinone biosynthesis methyltransferase UbiE [Sinorhizobium medicae]